VEARSVRRERVLKAWGVVVVVLSVSLRSCRFALWVVVQVPGRVTESRTIFPGLSCTGRRGSGMAMMIEMWDAGLSVNWLDEQHF
jgi:hypothetical protein